MAHDLEGQTEKSRARACHLAERLLHNLFGPDLGRVGPVVAVTNRQALAETPVEERMSFGLQHDHVRGFVPKRATCA